MLFGWACLASEYPLVTHTDPSLVRSRTLEANQTIVVKTDCGMAACVCADTRIYDLAQGLRHVGLVGRAGYMT